MDNGIAITLMPSQVNLDQGSGFAVSISGLIDTTFYSQVAQAGSVLSAQITPAQGGSLDYQWATVESGDIPGATGATLTVDADTYDGESLFCRVTVVGTGSQQSPSATIRHVAPALIGTLVDEVFDQGSGDQAVPLAGVFSGQAQTITLPGAPTLASYDEGQASVVIDTTSLATGVSVTVRSSNSGGFVETSFSITVEQPAGSISVEFDPLTAAGQGGVPVSGSTIASGNGSGHWEISGGLLVPTTAGDAADLGAGPYQLTLDDSQVIEVQVAPHPFTEDLWAISGPRGTGMDIVIFGLPSDSGMPITGIEMRFNGSAWQPIGGNVAGIYTIGGLVPETRYRVELRAMNGAAGQASAHGVVTVPDDPRGFRGWDPQIDLGTTGDWFVAPYGSDSNAGTNVSAPFRTIAAAISASSANDTIKVRAGIYRELINEMPGVILEGYGTEKPQITCGEKLTGWARCTDADSAVLSTVHAIPDNGPGDRSPVFKTTLPISSLQYIVYGGSAHTGNLAAPHLAINLHEAGQRVFMSKDQADMTSLFGHQNNNKYHQADSFTEGSDTRIENIVDASVINSSRYSDSQLLSAGCFVYGSPNVAGYAAITGADVANNTITVDANISRQSDTDPSTWLYALFNIPANLQQGTFAVSSDGTTATVYLYPYDETNLDLIEYSARDSVIKTNIEQDGCEVRGFHLAMATATGDNFGRFFMSNNNQPNRKGTNFRLEHCLMTGKENALWDKAQGVTLNQCEDSYMDRNTMYMIEGTAMALGGFGATGPGRRNRLSRNHFQAIGKMAFGWYDQWEMVAAHNLSEDVGLDAHASKSISYGPSGRSHDVIWWGNEFINCRGYLVWQNTSQPMVGFNWVPIFSGGAPWARSITDDNQYFPAIPVNDTHGYVFNNATLKHPSLPDGGPSIDVARVNSDIIYHLDNNIAHGMNDAGTISGVGGNLPAAASIRSNIVTWVNTGQSFDSTNSVQTDMSQVFTDAANEDFTPVAGSPILTVPGINHSAMVAAAVTRLPHFIESDRDYKFQLIDWNVLPVGPDAGLPFERGAAGAGLTLEASAMAAATDYRNNAAYGAMAYTPQNSSNDLLVAVALHNGATNASVTWRGQPLTALFVNTQAAANNRIDLVALYRTPAGAGAGQLVVTPTGESNALTVAFLEVTGLATDAIPGAQVVAGFQDATDQTDVTATLSNVTAGNAVLGIIGITGDAGVVDDAASDLTEISGGTITSSAGGALSDMTMQIQLDTDTAGASVTGTANYQNPAQAAFVLVELANQ